MIKTYIKWISRHLRVFAWAVGEGVYVSLCIFIYGEETNDGWDWGKGCREMLFLIFLLLVRCGVGWGMDWGVVMVVKGGGEGDDDVDGERGGVLSVIVKRRRKHV